MFIFYLISIYPSASTSLAIEDYPSIKIDQNRQPIMNNRAISAILSDIIGVAVEYDLHLKPNEFIQYLDLYSTYIGLSESVKKTQIDSPATFFEFISSQSLLELAASKATYETGERLIAPEPLHINEDSTPDFKF